ncbi:hypothetical protein [Cellulosilyticum ruminicola]|nr:hypothetical protein [Cellulosilyticum ruminicola]
MNYTKPKVTTLGANVKEMSTWLYLETVAVVAVAAVVLAVVSQIDITP